MDSGRVLRGARIKFAGIALSKLLMFGFALFVARKLGVDTFGVFTFSFAYASLWAIPMDLGLSVVVMRDFAVSTGQGEQTLSAAMAIRKGAVAVGLAGLVLGTVLMRLPGFTRELSWLIGLGMALETYTRIAAGVFRAREDLAADALVLVIQKALFVGLAVVLISAGIAPVVIGWAFLAGYAVDALWCTRALRSRQDVRPRMRLEWPEIARVARAAYPLALVDLFTLIYFRIDTVMLQAMRTETEVGLYNAAYRLIEAAMIFPMAFLAAAFAGFARGWETDRELLLADYRRSMEWMMAIAAPGVAIGFVLAPEVIRILFGAEFAGSVLDLRVLLFALLFIYPNYVLTQILIAGRQQNAYARYVAACAAFNVGANLLLIPQYGHPGAAIATVATEAVLFVLCFIRVRRRVGSLPLKKIVGVVIISTFLGLAVALARGTWPPGGWIVAVLGAVAILHYGIGIGRLYSGTADEDRDRHPGP